MHECNGKAGLKHRLKPGGLEHDGISGKNWSRARPEFKKSGLDVKLKEVPQTFADFLRLARLEEPALPWLDIETNIDDAEELRNTQEDMLTRALFSLQKGSSPAPYKIFLIE